MGLFDRFMRWWDNVESEDSERRKAEARAAAYVRQGASVAHRTAAAPPASDFPKTYPVGLVGESHCQAAIRAARPDEPVELAHEIDNPYDADAIAVFSSAGRRLGYIPRDSWVHRVLLDEGKGYTAQIKSIEGGRGQDLGVVIVLMLKGEEIGEIDWQAGA